LLAALLLLGVITGCGQPMNRATVQIGGLRFDVEVADSLLQQRAGLSGRKSVPEGTGMLFDFGRSATRTVWMKDMLVPLDIAWAAEGRVVEVRTLQPCGESDCPMWQSPGSVDALLEVPAGSLAEVGVGAAFTVAGG
jgi:uncharacterized membrane protein (UPF0127 family)